MAERLGDEYGPAARHWSLGGNEWDVVAESSRGGKLLLGEVKWTEKAPTASDVERAAQSLIATGVPPISGREKAELHYAIFVSQRPKSKPKMPKPSPVGFGPGIAPAAKRSPTCRCC